MDALLRFAVLFAELAFAALFLIWLGGLVVGSYGGWLLAEVSDAWRRWWWETFPLLTFALLVFAVLFAVAIVLGFEPTF